ncbi:MAG: rod shape-determining protein MreC [Smithellaceae bacterium]
MFFKNYRIVIFAIALFVIALITLSYHVKHDTGTGFVKKLVLEAGAPLQTVLSAATGAIGDSWKRYVYLVGLQEENTALKHSINELKDELILYKEGYLEALRLRHYLALYDQPDYLMIAARVIGREQAALSKTLQINKGSIHGLRVGMPVVAPPGLVGRLTDVSWHSSRVLLLTDESSNVDVMFQRTRVQGILRGAGPRGCAIKYVSKMQDVKEGDMVVSSGMSDVFPKGLLIGVVSSVDRRDVGLFIKIRVTPFVDFSKLEEVLVVNTAADLSAKGKQKATK